MAECFLPVCALTANGELRAARVKAGNRRGPEEGPFCQLFNHKNA